jgi:hypothetical protein
VTEQVSGMAHPIILDPEAAERRLIDAMHRLIGAAIQTVKSAPWGILPDPAHMAVLRTEVKRYELAAGEVDATAALLKLASEVPSDKAVEDAPTDIVTVGL